MLGTAESHARHCEVTCYGLFILAAGVDTEGQSLCVPFNLNNKMTDLHSLIMWTNMSASKTRLRSFAP